MKYITLIIGLLVVGCGKNPVVGIYQAKETVGHKVSTTALAIFPDGAYELTLVNGIVFRGEWEVVGDALQLHHEGGAKPWNFIIEGSRDLTWAKEDQMTFKKIK